MQPFIKAKKTLFICIDVQERLLGLMAHKDEVIKNTNILLESAQILKAPLLITEQVLVSLVIKKSKIISPKVSARVLYFLG